MFPWPVKLFFPKLCLAWRLWSEIFFCFILSIFAKEWILGEVARCESIRDCCRWSSPNFQSYHWWCSSFYWLNALFELLGPQSSDWRDICGKYALWCPHSIGIRCILRGRWSLFSWGCPRLGLSYVQQAIGRWLPWARVQGSRLCSICFPCSDYGDYPVESKLPWLRKCQLWNTPIWGCPDLLYWVFSGG